MVKYSSRKVLFHFKGLPGKVFAQVCYAKKIVHYVATGDNIQLRNYKF